MDAREARVDRNRSLELLDRLRQKTSLAIRAADKHAKLRPIAETLDHSLVEIFRLRHLSLFQVRESQRVLGVVVVRREFQRRFELASRLLEIAHHEIRLAEHVMCGRVTRVSRERALQNVYGFRILARAEVCDRKLDKSVELVWTEGACRLKRNNCRLMITLRRIDFAEALIGFGENHFELRFGRDEVAGAVMRIGRFVMTAKQIALDLEKDRE